MAQGKKRPVQRLAFCRGDLAVLLLILLAAAGLGLLFLLRAAGGGTVNHRVAARIALTWLFTFPGCGLLGFLLASLFRSPLSCGILMPGTIF